MTNQKRSLLEGLMELIAEKNENEIEVQEQSLFGRITDLVQQSKDEPQTTEAQNTTNTKQPTLAPPLEKRPTLAPPLPTIKPSTNEYTDLVFNKDDDNRRDTAKDEITSRLQDLQNAQSGDDFDDISDDIDDLLDDYEDVLSERELEAIEKHMDFAEEQFDKAQDNDEKKKNKEARKAEKRERKAMKKERKDQRKQMRESHKVEMEKFREEMKNKRGRGNGRGGPPAHAKGRGRRDD